MRPVCHLPSFHVSSVYDAPSCIFVKTPFHTPSTQLELLLKVASVDGVFVPSASSSPCSSLAVSFSDLEDDKFYSDEDE